MPNDLPDWAKCEHPLDDHEKSCQNPGAYGVIMPWGAIVICGTHRHHYQKADRLTPGWWRHQDCGDEDCADAVKVQ